MDYGSTKKSLREIWDDMIRRPFKTGGILLIALLTLAGTVGVSTYVSERVSTYSRASKVAAEAIPPKKLTYELLDKIKDEDGIYNTSYLLSVHIPIGDHRDKFTLHNNVDKQFAAGTYTCGVAYLAQNSEARGGLASTTYMYLEKCQTRAPILDTGELFTVSEVE